MEALRAGADAYLLKDGPSRHLLDAINFVRDGGVYIYLLETCGRSVAFLYGWMCLLVLDPGLTAALAMGAPGAHALYHAAMIALGSGRSDEGAALLRRVAALDPLYTSTFHAHH